MWSPFCDENSPTNDATRIFSRDGDKKQNETGTARKHVNAVQYNYYTVISLMTHQRNQTQPLLAKIDDFVCLLELPFFV